MSVNIQNKRALGASRETFVGVSAGTVVINRAPTIYDKANLGTFWLNSSAANLFVLKSITNGQFNWSQVTIA